MARPVASRRGHERDTESTRPLTARSVIASTLLGVDPPWLPTLALVRSGELFGLSAGATRTALSRMVAAGEAVPDGDGHRLAGALLARHGRQRVARASTPARAWDGTWVLAVVTERGRRADERARFRIAAERLRLVEWREGVWARPANLDLRADDGDAHARVSAHASWLTGARPDDIDDLVACFALDRWAEIARHHVDAMHRWQPRLDRGDTAALADTFLLDAAVQRHLVSDPRLPEALLEPDWPAPVLRATFERFDDAFSATWRTWYRTFRQGSDPRPRDRPAD